MITRKPSRPYVVVLRHGRRQRKNGAVYTLVSNAAAKSSYSEAHLRALLREHKVEGMKVGSVWLASRDALRAYEKRQAKSGR